MNDDYLVLALVNDHFTPYTILADNFDEAIQLFVNSIVPLHDDILFCGCWLTDEYVFLNTSKPCPVQTSWNNKFFIKTD